MDCYSLGNFSCYSFYGGVMRPEELVVRARELGYSGVGLADEGGMFGVVEFSQAARKSGMRVVMGCRLKVEGMGWVQFTVRNKAGYQALCRTLSHSPRVPGISVGWSGLERLLQEAGEGIWISLPLRQEVGLALPQWRQRMGALQKVAGERLWLELGWRTEVERSAQRRFYAECSLIGWTRWVVMSGARVRSEADAVLLETLQSIGTLSRVGQSHPDKLVPGEDALYDAEEWRRRWSKVPEVGVMTTKFVDGCEFDFVYGKLHLPGWRASGEDPPLAQEDNRRLKYLCLRGLAGRYALDNYCWKPVPARADILGRLQRELAIVRETGYAGYFLIFHTIVQECRRRGIALLARGSAAGSLICYALGVSNVCPFRFGLSFERFLNLERMKHSKLPDIDLDLPWDRRDEILWWLYERFGGDRIAMIGGFSTFQGRGAVAEVAKAMGMSAGQAHACSKRLPHGKLESYLSRRADYVEALPVGEDADLEQVLQAARGLSGLPRHAMMHPCGAVIADRPLTEFLPLQPSAKGMMMTQMDMHSVEDLGLLKLDLLGQAGLSVLRDAVSNLNEEGVANPWAGMDYRDPKLFAMVAAGEVRGVFHIESPAMISLLRLCRCADIDCLVATVSVIRPGAANEDKKVRFARRYLGLEPVRYAHPALESVLRDTYGLLIYEEHILFVAHEFAGMNYGTADLLRRLLVKKKDADALAELEAAFAVSAERIGRSPEDIRQVWSELRDFSGFMFNKAHGAAYAVEAAQGLWLRKQWPVHFLAAVLNNRRGFYSALVYVLEILRAGGRLQLPDVNRWPDRYQAHGKDVVIPLWQIQGLSERFATQWSRERARGAFLNWEDFVSRVQPDPSDASLLARAGALSGMVPNRHHAVWLAMHLRGGGRQKGGLGQAELWVAGTGKSIAKRPTFRSVSSAQCAEWEAELLGVPVSMTPFALWMSGWERIGTVVASDLEEYVGQEVEIAGLVVATRVHRTVRGDLMKFISIADETGIAEVTIFPELYRSQGHFTYDIRAISCRIWVGRDETDSGLLLQATVLYPPKKALLV